jgi:DeoR/GlpR family transcriptional regulator of sugar metabolism
VITNAYAVIGPLLEHGQVEIISTGGRYHPKTQTFVGGESYRSIRRHNIDRAFISCIGLDLSRGAAEGFQEQAIFKEMLVEVAAESILLVDSSKLNRRSEYFFANLEHISQIITDSGIRADQLEQLQSAGCPVTVAE